jgi:hypothetical protein
MVVPLHPLPGAIYFSLSDLFLNAAASKGMSNGCISHLFSLW